MSIEEAEVLFDREEARPKNADHNTNRRDQ